MIIFKVGVFYKLWMFLIYLRFVLILFEKYFIFNLVIFFFMVKFKLRFCFIERDFCCCSSVY